MALIQNFVIKLYLQKFNHHFSIKRFIIVLLIALLYINKILILVLNKNK
mgnify:CR=1 FL=1